VLTGDWARGCRTGRNDAPLTTVQLTGSRVARTHIVARSSFGLLAPAAIQAHTIHASLLLRTSRGTGRLAGFPDSTSEIHLC
jgi:hypothetical protein